MTVTFVNSDWLWLLVLPPVLALGKLWADAQAGRSVSAFAARRLRDTLVRGASVQRSWLIHGLQLLALSGFILALCRPQYGEEKREITETGRNVLIAIDTSRSMLADDISPDRLTRTKLAAQDLLETLAGDRVGLIAFAGQAYLQAPLTTDHDAVAESIQSLDFTSVPRGGSDLTKALRLAIETFEKTAARNHGLILFSDGGDPSVEVEAYAQEAAAKKILVLTIGVGTDAGALIPDPDPARPGDYVRDPDGNVVRSKLEGGVLQRIAAITHARYLKLGNQPITRGIVNDILSELDRQQAESKDQTKPIERFAWPLSVGMVLLMISWLIRPTSGSRVRLPAAGAAVALLLALPAPNAAAGESGAWAQLGALLNGGNTEASEARDAYLDGLYTKAKELYVRLTGKTGKSADAAELAYGLGASSHQLKDYDTAVGAFSHALEATNPGLQERAHRGLGHALYDQGDRVLAKQPKFTLKAWTDSVRHFDAALALDDSNQEVRENRDFVKKRLEELQQKMDEQKKQGQKNQGDKDGQCKNPGNQGKGQSGQGQPKDGDPQDQEQNQQDGENDEGKKPKDGKGEEQDGKKGQPLPEGRIQAGSAGDKDDSQKQSESSDDERNEMTGFSRNEARSFLRTYADDQRSAQYRKQRQEPFNGKDW